MTTDKKDRIPNAPALRFPGFKESWTCTTINEVCLEFQSGKSIRADTIHPQGSFPVYGGNGLRGYSEIYNHEGDYVLIGRQGALCGNVRFVTGKTYITEHAIAAKATDDNDTRFLQFLFSKMNLGQYSDQSAQPGLAVNKLLKLKIQIPQKEEQLKIARFLSLLQKRLETQSRAIEDLKQLRLALYQRVFTNLQGDSVSLKSVADVIKGNQINGDKLSENGKYYVMNGGVLPSGYYDEFNTPANTISISEGGNSCGFVQFNEEPFWSGGHCYTLQVCKTINVRYLFHYLKYKEQDIMKLRIGSGLPNIQKKDLEHFMVVIPNTNKQQKLASLFDCIQKKENIEKALLSQWQIQKRYLLQKMFI